MLGIAVSFNKKNFENPAMFRIIHKKGQWWNAKKKQNLYLLVPQAYY